LASLQHRAALHGAQLRLAIPGGNPMPWVADLLGLAVSVQSPLSATAQRRNVY